jgi:hypothetical protein
MTGASAPSRVRPPGGVPTPAGGLIASADGLIERQYADRPRLRPILDAVVDATTRLGGGRPAGAQEVLIPRRTASHLRPGPGPPGSASISSAWTGRSLRRVRRLDIHLDAKGSLRSVRSTWTRSPLGPKSRSRRRGETGPGSSMPLDAVANRLASRLRQPETRPSPVGHFSPCRRCRFRARRSTIQDEKDAVCRSRPGRDPS